MKAMIGILAAAGAPLALAHEGHGMGVIHWHATDGVGYLLLASIVAAALWASRRK
jgi:hypothetical protein